MSPSTSCIANGWIGQLSVQTVDFTILIISISVLSVVMSKSPTKQPSLRATIATCAAAWIPGIITSMSFDLEYSISVTNLHRTTKGTIQTNLESRQRRTRIQRLRPRQRELVLDPPRPSLPLRPHPRLAHRHLHRHHRHLHHNLHPPQARL